MDSRRDQFQLLEHFTSSIKDDSARPQIAQLTELGLVELTRKRQGQNIYELFGKKCEVCNGLGHIEHLLNYQHSNTGYKNNLGKSSNTNNPKLTNLDQSQILEKQEKTLEKELVNTKNFSKEDSIDKKENENGVVNVIKSKEKNKINISLSNDEKIVYSQLGINPLIKLGKEYLTSNNFAHLEDNESKKENKSNNPKLAKRVPTSKQKKQVTKSQSLKDAQLVKDFDENSKNNLSKEPIESNEIEYIDKDNSSNIEEETINPRKKRRRSSANIE